MFTYLEWCMVVHVFKMMNSIYLLIFHSSCSVEKIDVLIKSITVFFVIFSIRFNDENDRRKKKKRKEKKRKRQRKKLIARLFLFNFCYIINYGKLVNSMFVQ